MDKRWVVVTMDEGCFVRPYSEGDEEDGTIEIFESKGKAKKEAIEVLRCARKRLGEMLNKVIEA